MGGPKEKTKTKRKQAEAAIERASGRNAQTGAWNPPKLFAEFDDAISSLSIPMVIGGPNSGKPISDEGFVVQADESLLSGLDMMGAEEDAGFALTFDDSDDEEDFQIM